MIKHQSYLLVVRWTVLQLRETKWPIIALIYSSFSSHTHNCHSFYFSNLNSGSKKLTEFNNMRVFETHASSMPRNYTERWSLHWQKTLAKELGDEIDWIEEPFSFIALMLQVGGISTQFHPSLRKRILAFAFLLRDM